MIGFANYNLIDASNDIKDIVVNFITQYYIGQKIVPANVVTTFADDSLSLWLSEFAGKKINLLVGARDPYSRLIQMCNENASEYLSKSIEKNKLDELKTIGAIKTLQKALGLNKLPKRIEGYDISNLSGTNTVASMVVFTNGSKDAKMYRKFKILTDGQNDFRNMNEVLSRRLAEYKLQKDISFSTLPDLILIDGGIIQLTFAREALAKFSQDIEIISLAKKQEEIYRVDGSKVILSRDNFALKLLQNVRDESHRFAITFQKNLRKKNTLMSELEKIDGIGKNRVNKIFEKFGSIDKIKNASLEELKSVSGVGEALAENIYNYFKK